MPRHQVTVVLPCAGSGSRLGLPFPKELAPAGPGRCVIDSSLGMIRAACAASDVRMLLMTDGKREQTASYIRGRLPGVPLAEARQDPAARDMTEAVIGLEPWLSYVNVLLLPDAVYQWAGDPVSEVAANAVSSGFAVGAVKGSAEEIQDLGALQVHGDRVVAFEDKPAGPVPYGAFWVMLGFSSGKFGMDGLRLIAESAAKTRTGPVAESPLLHAPVTWLAGYRDCGTWDRYAAQVRGPA